LNTVNFKKNLCEE